MTPSDLDAIRRRAAWYPPEDFEDGALADACADRAALLAYVDALEGRLPAATPKRKPGGLAAIVGKWPGDETDEEIEEGLAALEDPTRHIASPASPSTTGGCRRRRRRCGPRATYRTSTARPGGGSTARARASAAAPSTPTGPAMTIPEIVALCRAYYADHPSGGTLHVVLDDGNTEIEFVEECRADAVAAGDARAVEIADALLAIDDDQRWSLWLALRDALAGSASRPAHVSAPLARRDRVVCERFLAGEPLDEIARDYGIATADVLAILRAGLAHGSQP